MHEIGLARGLIEAVMNRLPSADLPRVAEISIRLGSLAGVSEDHLRFGLATVTKDTPLEPITVNIVPVPARAHCDACDIGFPADEPLACCPTCGRPSNIVEGTELLLESVSLKP